MDSRARVLNLLRSNPWGLRQADIARALGLSRSRVSEIVRELERAGLVKRVREGSVELVVPVDRGARGPRELSRRVRLGIVWSSEYPFIAVFAKLLRDRIGADLQVVVYSNGLDATWDLIGGRIDLVLSPLVTQVLFYSLTSALRIIGGGAAGGASVFYNPRGVPGVTSSTRASTMDLCISRASKELGYGESVRLYQARGSDIVHSIELGRAQLVAVWEPLATRLRMEGFREVATCLELGIVHCCTLAAPSDMEWEELKRLAMLYQEAINTFARNPEPWIEWYSARVGIEASAVRKALSSYVYVPYVDVEGAVKMLRDAGVSVPSPTVLREAVLEVAR